MALRQFLEYHFDGSVSKLRIFLEQPIEKEEGLPQTIAVDGLGGRGNAESEEKLAAMALAKDLSELIDQ
jgi:hypothetical protein